MSINLRVNDTVEVLSELPHFKNIQFRIVNLNGGNAIIQRFDIFGQLIEYSVDEEECYVSIRDNELQAGCLPSILPPPIDLDATLTSDEMENYESSLSSHSGIHLYENLRVMVERNIDFKPLAVGDTVRLLNHPFLAKAQEFTILRLDSSNQTINLKYYRFRYIKQDARFLYNVPFNNLYQYTIHIDFAPFS